MAQRFHLRLQRLDLPGKRTRRLTVVRILDLEGPVTLSKFNDIYGSEPQYIQAATLMTIVIPMVIFFFAQRAFMRGIVITGVEK